MILKEPIPRKTMPTAKAYWYAIYAPEPVETAAEKRDVKMIHHGYRWRLRALVAASNKKNAMNVYRYQKGLKRIDPLKAYREEVATPDVYLNLREWKKVNVIFGFFNEWATDGLHHWCAGDDMSACGKKFARFEVRTGKPRCPVCLEKWERSVRHEENP